MLEFIKRDAMERCEDIEDEFSGCMFIVIDINNDFSNLKGKLYCVSRSSDSYEELEDVGKDLCNQGYDIAVLGLYTNVCAPGLQCVIEDV